ncbi:MAG: hypothetical protein E6J17_01980, partial [Chloroflexi bacterium]
MTPTFARHAAGNPRPVGRAAADRHHADGRAPQGFTRAGARVPAVSPERRTRFSTISDVEVERLYGRWSWSSDVRREPTGPGGPTAVDHHGEPLAGGRWDSFDADRDIGLPGEPPFLRGIHPNGYRTRLWTMRM